MTQTRDIRKLWAVDEICETQPISRETDRALLDACTEAGRDPYARRVSLDTIWRHLPRAARTELAALLT